MKVLHGVKFKEEVLTPLVGEAEDRIPRLRRLFLQAYTVAVSELERLADPTTEEVQQMHPVEGRGIGACVHKCCRFRGEE